MLLISLLLLYETKWVDLFCASIVLQQFYVLSLYRNGIFLKTYKTTKKNQMAKYDYKYKHRNQ